MPASILNFFHVFSLIFSPRCEYYFDNHLQMRKLRLKIQTLWARTRNWIGDGPTILTPLYLNLKAYVFNSTVLTQSTSLGNKKVEVKSSSCKSVLLVPAKAVVNRKTCVTPRCHFLLPNGK